MKAFHSGREAKEFVISEIVEEAQRENIPLSEIERKILYFTESGWTLPDIMKVNEDFDRECDHDDFEHKIAKLVRKTDRRLCNDSREDYERWWAAIRFLEREDHYISVMLRLAGLRPRGDQLRLFVTALGVVACILILVFLSVKFNISIPPTRNLRMFVWVVFGCLAVAYMLSRVVLGSKRTDDFTSQIVERVVRAFQRVSGSA